MELIRRIKMFKKSGFKPTRENMKSAGGFSAPGTTAPEKRKKFSAALKSKVKKPNMQMKNLMKGM
jgi:hypothetical protein